MGNPIDQRFRRSERLLTSADVDRVFAAKCSRGDELLVVYAVRNSLAWSRLGIITGKRVGPAVRRNYARRRIREAFRNMKAELPIGFDFVCLARPAATDRERNVAASLKVLMTQAAVKANRIPEPNLGHQ